MMDFDHDGYLHPSDLICTQELIDPESDFGMEVAKLMDFALQNIMKDESGIHDRIDLFKFKGLNE